MNKNPWDRRPGESPYWYERFKFFLEMGPERSLEDASRKWHSDKKRHFRGIPKAWIRAFERDEWDRRAKSFDEEKRREEEAQFDSVKDGIKKRLLIAMKKCVDDLMSYARMGLLPATMTLPKYISTVDKLVDIYQKYFDETPTQRTEEKNLGRSLLINMGDFALPPEPEKTNGEEGKIGGTD